MSNLSEAALCREPNNEYLPLLHLAQCFEETRWADVEAMIQQLGLDASKVTAAFQKSVDWADELESLRSEKPGKR